MSGFSLFSSKQIFMQFVRISSWILKWNIFPVASFTGKQAKSESPSVKMSKKQCSISLTTE